ncbi:MAG: methionyl-tRNA formyltransferase [Clostridia bacterium]|nr:methionyl-tRNA formyltransferase [Clostridia bacterium]
MRIIFMGTPDFAVPSLQALIDAGHEICAVFTQPDKPKGRGHAMAPPPVKELALKYGLTVYQPRSMKKGPALEIIQSIAPDVIVVVAFGKILPLSILSVPRLGCVNVHGSLLPQYRGSAPIQWTVLNGDKVTGVTTMLMNEGIDTGDILDVETTEVGENETSGELFDRLMVMGAELLPKTLEKLENGTAVRTPQPEEGACYAPMLDKAMADMDWNKSADELHNLVRGLNPWPVAVMRFEGKRMKVFDASVLSVQGTAGEAFVGPDRSFCVYCGKDALCLNVVQPENKKRMSGADFLLGHPLNDKNRNLL